MPISTFISNTVSISTNEISMINGNTTINSNTTAGIYQAFIDLNAMAASDSFEYKVYEKTISGGTQRVIYNSVFTGVQSTPIYVTISLILLNGWDMTLTKISGTDRSIVWSIRQIS